MSLFKEFFSVMFFVGILIGGGYFINYFFSEEVVLDCKREMQTFSEFEKKILSTRLESELYRFHGIQRDIDNINKYYFVWTDSDFFLKKSKFLNKYTELKDSYLTSNKKIKYENKRSLLITFKDSISDPNKQGVIKYNIDINIDKIDLKVEVVTREENSLINNYQTFFNCKVVEPKI